MAVRSRFYWLVPVLILLAVNIEPLRGCMVAVSNLIRERYLLAQNKANTPGWSNSTLTPTTKVTTTPSTITIPIRHLSNKKFRNTGGFCVIPFTFNGKFFSDGQIVETGEVVDKGALVVLLCNGGYQSSPTAEYLCRGWNVWLPAMENCTFFKPVRLQTPKPVIFELKPLPPISKNTSTTPEQTSKVGDKTQSSSTARSITTNLAMSTKAGKVTKTTTKSAPRDEMVTQRFFGKVWEIEVTPVDLNSLPVLKAGPSVDYDEQMPTSISLDDQASIGRAPDLEPGEDESGEMTTVKASKHRKGSTPATKTRQLFTRASTKPPKRRWSTALPNKGGTFDPELGPAAASGRFKKMARIVEDGADINAHGYEDGCGFGSTNQTALMVAVACNQTETIVTFLVEKGADVNSRDEYGQTVLNAAAWKSTAGIVRLLLEAGADVNATADDGFSALLWATISGDLQKVWELLNCGADPNAADIDGWSPLIEACNKSRSDIARWLIDFGADVNCETKDGYTPLIYAASHGDLDTLKLVVNHGADDNASATDGTTALIWAAIIGDVDSTLFLLQCGVDVNARDGDGFTALLWAVGYSKTEVVRALLISTAIDIDAPDKEGVTPLMFAVKNNLNQTIEMLLEREADVNAKDKDGWTPLIYAISTGNRTIVPVVKRLLDKGAKINEKDNGGNTAMTYAMEHGISGSDMTMFLVLLQKGADINAKNNTGTTLLMMAAKAGLNGLVKLLLDNGADINARDQTRNTALVYAAANAKVDTLKLLRSRGASRDGCIYFICSTA